MRVLASGRFQARYVDRNGRTRSRSFDTRREAAEHLAEARTDLKRGRWLDPAIAGRRFGEYAEEWLAARVDRKPTTRRAYAGHAAPARAPRARRLPAGGAHVRARAQLVRRPGLHESPTWSRDGRQIAFRSSYRGKRDAAAVFDLRVLDVRSGRVRTLYRSPGLDCGSNGSGEKATKIDVLGWSAL